MSFEIVIALHKKKKNLLGAQCFVNFPGLLILNRNCKLPLQLVPPE